MARWTASEKWAEGPAIDGRRDMPLVLRLSDGLGLARERPIMLFDIRFERASEITSRIRTIACKQVPAAFELVKQAKLFPCRQLALGY